MSSLAGCFWLRVSQEGAIKVSGLQSFESLARLEDVLPSSLTRLMGERFSSLPHGPPYRAAQDIIAGFFQLLKERQISEREKEGRKGHGRGRERSCNVFYKLISKVIYHG